MSRPHDARARALQLLEESLRDNELHSLTLARPLQGPPGLKQVLGRPVVLKAGPHLQLVSRFERVDKTRNVPLDAAVAEIGALLGAPFTELHLRTARASWHLQAHPGKAARLHEAAPASAPALTAHDRPKSRALEPDPRWLTALGVLGPDGKVKRGMESKLRQVLRFAELLDDALLALPPGPLRLVDMGCGKGYLTFVAFELLSARRPGSTVVGVELRPALVDTCSAAAAAAGFAGLSFVAGAIADAPLQGADVVLALHACDTATDDALAAAVFSGAGLILAAPCCHKELRPQLQPPAALAPALRHGIVRTREAELLTDALRAALLDAQGYDTALIEFIDAEHTAKNLLLVATRKGQPDAERARAAVALAGHYGVRQQRLAGLLGVSL